jgi:hypothetical protein
MTSSQEPQGDTTPGLIEPEGANAASSDPDPDDADGAEVVSSSGARQGIAEPEDAAPDGDLLGPPDQQGAQPGQELSAGEG